MRFLATGLLTLAVVTLAVGYNVAYFGHHLHLATTWPLLVAFGALAVTAGFLMAEEYNDQVAGP